MRTSPSRAVERHRERRIGGAEAVVREHEDAATGRALEQAALELGPLGSRERQRILDVEADHLLLDGVACAGEHPCLAGGAIAASHQDAVDRDAAAGEQVEQRAPGLVVADESDRQRPAAQGVQIGDRVAAAAGHQLLAVVAEDQHRRLPADAFRRAADEAIRDQVAEHQDRLFREPVDQLEQTSRIGDARWRGHGR